MQKERRKAKKKRKARQGTALCLFFSPQATTFFSFFDSSSRSIETKLTLSSDGALRENVRSIFPEAVDDDGGTGREAERRLDDEEAAAAAAAVMRQQQRGGAAAEVSIGRKKKGRKNQERELFC